MTGRRVDRRGSTLDLAPSRYPLQDGLTGQRAMEREDPAALPPSRRPGAVHEMTFSANSANTVRVVITEVEHQ